jgi:uncharacterized protein (TIGR02118 family)
VEKLISVIRRTAGLDATGFRRDLWACVDEAPPSPHRILNLVEFSPEDCSQPAHPGYPDFDAAEERWFDSERDLERYCKSYRKPACASVVFHYQVAENVRKEGPKRMPGQRTPGVKQLYLTLRAPGQSHADFVRHWRDVHGPLALRRHVGMSKYVQNVVARKFGAGAPEIDGIPELHFASLDDACNRRYDSAEGKAAIAADRPNFVTRSIPLFCGEYPVNG